MPPPGTDLPYASRVLAVDVDLQQPEGPVETIPGVEPEDGGIFVSEEHVPGAARAGERGFGLVEALVALVVFAIGALAVAAVALHVSQLTTRSAVATDQTFAVEQVFSILREEDFDAVSSGEETVQVGDHSYTVERDVTQLTTDTKEVVATVSGVTPFPPDTFRTVLHRPTGYPTSP